MTQDSTLTAALDEIAQLQATVAAQQATITALRLTTQRLLPAVRFACACDSEGIAPVMWPDDGTIAGWKVDLDRAEAALKETP